MAQIPAVTVPANERRASRRTRARDAILVCGPGGREFKCTITDVSTTGAGVRICQAASIPDAPYLISLEDRRAYATIVTRRKGTALGLKLVSVIDLSKLMSRDLEFLTKIWFRHASA